MSKFDKNNFFSIFLNQNINFIVKTSTRPVKTLVRPQIEESCTRPLSNLVNRNSISDQFSTPRSF